MSTAVIITEESGRKALAIPTGVSAADFARSEIGSLKRESGWIVRDSGIEPWPILGFVQREGQIHFWGQHHPGVRLEDCLDDAPEENLGRLKSLTSALLRLQSEKVPVFRLRTDGVFFLDDRSVLFMPPSMMQRIELLRPFSERVRTYNFINNPELQGEKALSFSLGALLYRMLLGSYPFTGEDDVAVNSRIRSFRVTPPALLRPDIRPELSDAIVRALDRGGRDAPELRAWDATLYAALTGGHLREVNEGEREKAKLEARERTERNERGFRRAVFFQRNWRLMGTIGGILVLVGAIGGSILSNVLAPRVTKGFDPRKVVETFYTSMNTLDHTTMEDCVIEKAGQGEVNEAMNLFVMSRVTVGYEGRSYIVSAEDWEKEGRPELSADKTLYGAILRNVEEEDAEPTPVFLVTYEKWTPEPDREGEAEKRMYGYERVERVRLKQDKGDWVIYDIERLSSTPVTGE